MDSLRKAYGQALYVKITIRPAPARPGSAEHGFPGTDMVESGKAMAIGVALQTLGQGLRDRIRLEGPDGGVVRPLSAVLRGTGGGAVSTLLVLFPRSMEDAPGRLEGYEIVIDDLGMNTGTLRRKLPPAPGLRLKVAA